MKQLPFELVMILLKGIEV
jgi:hypothetical protein